MSDEQHQDGPSGPEPGTPERDPDDEGACPGDDAERRLRRARFLRELHEAQALRARVKPRQARAARLRRELRMRAFRW